MATTLFLSASLLGLLGFFDANTIATNTHYIVRAHQLNTKKCCRSLLSVWIIRSILYVGLLLGLVSFIKPLVWA